MCQNLLKNRFFSFKMLLKYECFCELLPNIFYKLSATQIHHTVQCDGWGLLIIFTEEWNSSCNILALKCEGILPAHLLPHEVIISCNPCFFKQLSYFIHPERWEQLIV